MQYCLKCGSLLTILTYRFSGEICIYSYCEMCTAQTRISTPIPEYKSSQANLDPLLDAERDLNRLMREIERGSTDAP